MDHELAAAPPDHRPALEEERPFRNLAEAAGAPLSPATGVAEQRRDRALDVLRGWAIVKMIAGHLGTSKINALTHLSGPISAAEPFVILSGVVLGMRARRSTRESLRQLYAGLLRRAAKLLVIHYALTLVVLTIHEWTGRLSAPALSEVGGLGPGLLQVLTLQLQPKSFMNILPLYVVFLALAPVAIHGLRRGRSDVVLLGSCALWAVAQAYPELIPFAGTGELHVSFSLAAWQFVFVLGLCAGFHRESSIVPLWRKHRTALLVGLTSAVLGALCLRLLRDSLPELGVSDARANWGWALERATWGPIRAGYTLTVMGLSYLAVRSLRERGIRPILVQLEQLGQRSLPAFVVHLVLVLSLSTLGVSGWSPWLHELAIVATIAAVFALVRDRRVAHLLPR